MVYSVKEVFYSIQGEGVHAGRPCVFIRFAGCNLWSGREQDRAKAVCNFCDTDIVGTNGQGGGKFASAQELANYALGFWPKNTDKNTGKNTGKNTEKWLICTGGEPLLQLDDDLIFALSRAGFKIAIETNGTIKAPTGIDWICVSPKADAKLLQKSGHELKLVYPQAENRPEDFEHLDFAHFSLQPLQARNNACSRANIKAALDYCLANPKWRLSLQTHKILGVR